MEVHPGPLSFEVLNRQHVHRSTDVWNSVSYTTTALHHRMHLRHIGKGFVADPRVLHYIRLAGFYCIYKLGSTFEIDDALITALVERWRPETHTFHLKVGEVTITLHDVAVLLGLRVDGLPVTGTANCDWQSLCGTLLGAVPKSKDLRGSSISMRWLRDQLGPLPDDANDHLIQCHARCYLLLLMGCVTFADTSGGRVQLLYLPLIADLKAASQYSWGSATLGFLYRQLCRATMKEKADIVGPIILLQLWAWEHIPIGRPRCVYCPTGGDEKEARKAARKEARRKKGAGSQPPPFGVHFEDGQDSLALRWLSCKYSWDCTPTTLLYYRDAFDRQLDNQFVWEPYTSDVMEHLANICHQGSHIWRTTAPMICFDIVEWHHPERVMRQFGDVQVVPGGCSYEEDLHKVDRRGKPSHDWAAHHKQYIELWNKRDNSIVVAPDVDNVAQVTEQYMTWYRRITRRLINPPSRSSPGVYQPCCSDDDCNVTMTQLLKLPVAAETGSPNVDKTEDSERADHEKQSSPIKSAAIKREDCVNPHGFATEANDKNNDGQSVSLQLSNEEMDVVKGSVHETSEYEKEEVAYTNHDDIEGGEVRNTSRLRAENGLAMGCDAESYANERSNGLDFDFEGRISMLENIVYAHIKALEAGK